MLRNQPTIAELDRIFDNRSKAAKAKAAKAIDNDKETTMTTNKTNKAAAKATVKKSAKAKAANVKNKQVKELNAKAKAAAKAKAKPAENTPKADTPKLTGAAYLQDKLNKRTAYIAAHAADGLKLCKATNKFTGADLCADEINAYFVSLFIKVNKYRSHKFATVKQAAKNGLKLKDGAKGVDIFYTNKHNKLAFYTVYNMAEFVKAA